MQQSFFHGKTAVITGAGGTLCSAIAKDLARQGAKVALLGRTVSSLDGVANEIRAAGGIAVPVTCDVVDLASVERARETVSRELGHCSFLLNGAGGNHAEVFSRRA
jgi:NAD(P)-dependent dehydrogenase (short-subunit alcohol dehydrogenase family)